MRYYKLQISALFVMLCQLLAAQGNYTLQLKSVDKDSAFLVNQLAMQTRFADRLSCIDYVNKLPAYLQTKGYVTASLDSILFDTLTARLHLYLGNQYRWADLNMSKIDPGILTAVGWRPNIADNKALDFSEIDYWQQRFLDYLENNGYPFANIFLDSIQLNNNAVKAQWIIDKGIYYKIDSIRVFGKGRMSVPFLYRYLQIPISMPYSKTKLAQVGKKIKELAYVEEETPSNLSLLPQGAVLNLYLRPKKSSQMNVLIGLLPNSNESASRKMMVTGEANILLKNVFTSGETIGLNWQQLQRQSPRLSLIFQFPYVFHSPLGLDLAFDMFRKDTTFLNINLQLGTQYFLNSNQSGKLFIQKFQTIVNGVNISQLLVTRQLPAEVDVSTTNFGIEYSYNNTDYKLNPRKGNELKLITTIGTKKIKKNSRIVELEDPSDPDFDFEKLYDSVKLKSYQFRITANATHFFPIGRQSTIKTAVNGGFFQNAAIFRNELFQLGGFKLLRGFDEESQYLSQYAIATAEYRILTGAANSYFYALIDAGWGKNNSLAHRQSYTYLSTGLGLSFENKVGIFNIAWAVGKRNDTRFDLRQSKIHLGFVNYF